MAEGRGVHTTHHSTPMVRHFLESRDHCRLQAPGAGDVHTRQKGGIEVPGGESHRNVVRVGETGSEEGACGRTRVGVSRVCEREAGCV